MYGERFLRTLHGNDLDVPGVGEAGVEELEPGWRLDVSDLQIGDMRQAEQRTAGTARGFCPAEQIVADQVRLTGADLDGPVRG